MAKEPTEKQLEARRKFAEASRRRAAERRAAKEAKENQTVEKGPELAPGQEPTTTISQAQYNDLMRQIQELKSMGFQPETPGTIGIKGGQLIGSVEKFDLNPNSYPNPCERLSKESRLQRFAFDINFDLTWNVATVEYTTIDGVRTKEPKFTLELGRKLYDEETGEPMLDKDGQPMGYIISRLIMHEDPDAALTIAREQNIEVDETSEKQFLDEMRYLRCRDWLLQCFFPAPQKDNKGKKEMVIGGKLVETYTVTSEKSEKIPFDQIQQKKL